MGIWFEGGDLNVHFGVIPTIFAMIVLNVLIGFALLIGKNSVSKSFNKSDNSNSINKV